MRQLARAVGVPILASLCLGGLVWAALRGYDAQWTGFGQLPKPLDGTTGPKLLWDWLQLLIVPVILAIGIWLLEGSRKKSDRGLQEEAQRQIVLDDYLKAMSEMIVKGELLGSTRDDRAVAIARIRTFAALRRLDGSRKAQLLQFLAEAGLIWRNPVLALDGADFDRALLDEANLSGTELRGAYFRGASFRNATLRNADFRGSDFTGAALVGAVLTNTDLRQSILRRANLKKADLSGVQTDEADLSRARMARAIR